MHGMARAFLASSHKSFRVRGFDMPMSVPGARERPQRGQALVPVRDVYMSPSGTKHKTAPATDKTSPFQLRAEFICGNTFAYLRK